ncbi:MAG: FmdE family protein [Deltaproteobacteria bacterium]|jgi:formylmethanofuran dehydrogenase subunit E|nr:FmdE family protein [Deltaproteobacteria bacterium]
MPIWQDYLDKANAYHGHICGGQILGIRMALLGLRLLGLEPQLQPQPDYRDLVIYLESDRCVADAAYVVTGVTIGRRRVKLHNYGKTAMSFLDLKSGQAYRISVTDHERPDKSQDLVAFWANKKDQDIFRVQKVNIQLKPGEEPGPPSKVALCQKCGDEVMDHRDVQVAGQTLCRACAEGSYYEALVEIKL